MAPPSELSRLLCNQEWEAAIELAQARPMDARHWSWRQGFFEGLKDAHVLPLHECLVGDAPVQVTLAVIEAYPDAVYQRESSYQRLPLHCACRRHTSVQVVQLLLRYHADANLEPDQLGRLPLHYALSNGANLDIITLLLQTHPAAARGLDARGWTPLHVACSMGASVEVVQSLLNAYPEAIVMRTKRGSSAARCLSKDCPHRQQLKELLIRYKQDFDANHMPLGNNRQPEELMLV